MATISVSMVVLVLGVVGQLTTTIGASQDYHAEFYEALGHLEVVANLTQEKHGHDVTPAVGTQFECTGEPSAEVPTSVHALRPGDIKVVTAVGDSITAAFGAKARTILGISTEYRGVSWSIGGDGAIADTTTVPNFMRKFNPSLHGWSVGTGGESSSNARLNKAVSGAVAADIPGQLTKLIAQMQYDPNMDYENDWKMLTLWIGGNDLCAVCKGNEMYQPPAYLNYVKTSLDFLHNTAKVPRLLVNVVQILDVSRLNEVKGLICSLVHFVACSCATTDGDAARQKVKEAAEEYQLLVGELISSGVYDTREDFTVVLQPFFLDTVVPKKADGSADTSYFAPDCFHFSAKGHAVAATALWNNMLEPVGSKSTEWEIGQEPLCPTEAQPYLFTNLNSAGFTAKGPNGNTQTPLTSSTTAVAVGTVCAAVVVVAIVAIVLGKRQKARLMLTEQTPLVVENNDSTV